MDDCYIFRPFPSVWNCGVVHPFGLDPLCGDVKSLQGFCRSLEVLTHIKKEVDALGIVCGFECSSSEGEEGICVVLFPWNEEELPDATALLSRVFHVHPELLEEYLNTEDQGRRIDEKIYYHLPHVDGGEPHHGESPCLNHFFNFYPSSLVTGQEFDVQDARRGAEFFAWLQNILVPTITVYAGETKLNPVLLFLLTNLAPGWVGGALTGETWT